MPFPHGHALMIGVGTYQHAPQHNVPITISDAQELAQVVQDEQCCGYPPEQVTVLSDHRATRANILTALDQLAHTCTDDTVLLFYSGHGVYDTDGTYTLTTHDTHWHGNRVIPSTAISQVELLTKLRDIPAQRILLLFNACHAGELSPTLGDGAMPIGQALPTQTAHALLATGTGRIVMTACREHQYSFIGSGKLTLFAQALVDGLRGGGDVYNRRGYISAFDLYTHVYYALTEAVAQHVAPALKQHYGSTQEPELTVLKGVGPFAVALYRGASTGGPFPADQTLSSGTAAREVDPTRSQRILQHMIGAASVQGNHHGQQTGINTGVMTSHTQIMHNQASNQGAQGTFYGSVTLQIPPTPPDQQDAHPPRSDHDEQ